MAAVGWDALLAAAREASLCAYAHYSGFKVGAAAAVADGAVYAGCNVENASFGLTVCAERNAIAAAVAGGLQPGGLQRLVVYTDQAKPATPCGACRQVLAEFAAPGLLVRCCGSDGFREFTLAELLPEGFSLP